MRNLAIIRSFAVVGLLAIGLPFAARAEIPYCEGLIQKVYVSNVGDVVALPSWRNDWIVYCNLNAPRGSVSPTTCALWAATLLLAYRTQKSTITSYWDNPTAKTCATMATYGSADVPTYVMVN